MTIGAAESSPLTDRKFRVFAVGNVVNNLGETAFMGIGPLLLASQVGLAAAGVYVIAVGVSSLASPWIGAAIDRHGWQRFFVAGLVGQALSIGTLLLLLDHNSGSLPAYAAVIVVNQISANAYLNGWKVGLGDLFPAFRKRARASLNTMFYAAGVVGPLLGFVILRQAGYAGFLVFNLATFVAPLTALTLIAGPRMWRATTRDGTADRHGILRGVLVVVTVISRDRSLRTLLVFYLCLAAMSGSVLSVLIVVRFGASDQPLLVLAIVNLCVYAGNQVVSALRAVRPRLVLWCCIGTAVAGAALIPAAAKLASGAGIALLGVAIGIGISYYVIALVEFAPPALYGSVSGVFGLMSGVVVLTSGVVVSAAVSSTLAILYGYLWLLAVGLLVSGATHLRALTRHTGDRTVHGTAGPEAAAEGRAKTS